jgi:ribosomal protein L7/L12
MAEVERLVRGGQKINAIKLVREQTNWGLKEAKDFVEALEAGKPLPAKPNLPDYPRPSDTSYGSPDWTRIREQLAAGRKIEAIKIYREQTGVGLKEAKDAVEMFERGQTPPPPNISAPPPTIPGHINLDEIRQLLAAGNKIEAVKRYREQTGLGLKESLDVIDAMPEARTAAGGAPGAGGGGGCLRALLGTAFFILLLLSSCGLYVQTTDEYDCGMALFTGNREVVQRLGEPVEATPLALVLGYSSSSDFGGNSYIGFAMYTLVTGANGNSWVYMDINHDDGSPYYMNANLFYEGDNIRINSSVSENGCTP